jgi:hypothetical protein
MQIVHLKNLGKPNLIISDCANDAGKNVKYQAFKKLKIVTSLPQF